MELKPIGDIQEFDYDLTILIPVYNAENFIEDTIKSVIKQNIKDKTYEVILINDGSNDRSNEICEKYTNIYDNFKYYYHSNKGVSYTRNRGLNLAKGKYILFLDADDLLAQGTLISVINAFDHFKDEADLLAYPLYKKINDYITSHVRNKEFTKKGKVNIYDIEDFPNLNQCTMNIVIKNLPSSEKVYFNENLKQSEDALFNTSMIMKKGKIIFSKEGGYLYNIAHDSAVNHYKNPVDIKDMLLEYFEKLISISLNKETNEIPKYVQSMILYELNWRFVQNTLFPNHLSEEKFSEWMDRVKRIFTKIEISTILNKNLMDFYHKMYIIKTFKGNINYINNSYGITFEANGTQILKYENITLVFNKIKIIEDSLNFVGFVKAPLLDIAPEINLIIEDDDNIKINVPLSISPASYYKTKMDIAKFYGFDFKLSLKKRNKFKFFVEIGNHKYNVTHWFENNIIFKKYLGSKYVVTNKKIISYNSNPFEIVIENKKDNREKAKNILNHQKELMLKGKQHQLLKFEKTKKFIQPILKNKKIWLYNDRVGVLDNAYYQFMHDVKKRDGIKRYYVIRKEDIGNPKFPDENIVEYGSLKHKVLYYYADLILTSFKEFIEYSPLSYRANNLFYSEMTSKVIYLQHGVLNAHTPWLYGKHVTSFDKFLISSHFEKENLLNNYGYKESDLLESGMPRLDNIVAKDKKKKILLAPSWRKSFVNEETGLNRTINIDSFKKSNYYQGLSNIINSTKLDKILEKYGYTLDVKMHPIFIEQSSLFETDKKNINVLNKDTNFNLNDYELFITDFSSYMFDFIKSMTKIVFFMPDYEYFLSGNHIYNKLDFDVSKFSGIYTRSADLINYIEKEIVNNFNINGSIYNLYNDFYFKHVGYKDHLYNELKKIQ
ncbi:glycosyltransferase [Staphylococcus sp. GSSP0090]|nr:glycosyltransferase [Staphylococcus sp. GSSP0090]